MTLFEKGKEDIAIIKFFEGKTVFGRNNNGSIYAEYKIKKLFFDEKEGLFGRWMVQADHRYYSSSQKPKKWRRDLVFGADVIDHICISEVDANC
jgi:hypothetical protein